MSFANTNWIEAIWLVINSITLAVTILNLRAGMTDLDAVKRLNGRAREIHALGSVKRDAVRCAVQSMFLAVGILAALLDPRPPAVTPQIVIFLAAVALLLYPSVSERNDRRAILHLIKREINESGVVVTQSDEGISITTTGPSEVKVRPDGEGA